MLKKQSAHHVMGHLRFSFHELGGIASNKSQRKTAETLSGTCGTFLIEPSMYGLSLNTKFPLLLRGGIPPSRNGTAFLTSLGNQAGN
eukprot:4822777-Amphidinium_carterae.1